VLHWTNDFAQVLNICDDTFEKKESIFSIRDELETIKKDSQADLKKKQTTVKITVE